MEKVKKIEKNLINQLDDFDIKDFTFQEKKFFNKKKILITGVSGQIGINLLFFFNKLDSIKKIKIEIDGTYNTKLFNFIKSYFKKKKNFSFLKIDLTKSKPLFNKKYDLIFHCAGYGQPSKFMKNKKETFLLNSKLVIDFKKYLKENGKFVYMSSTEIYSGNKKKCKEDDIGFTGPLHPRSAYIDSKKFGESYIVNMFNNYLIFRVCLTYGPGVKLDDERVLNQVILRSINNNSIDVYGGLNQLRSNLYIVDAIKMIIKATTKTNNTILNLNNNKLITLGKIFRLISKMANKKLINHKPRLFGSPNIIKISNSKILDLLNYKISVDQNEGLKKTRKWYEDLIKLSKMNERRI
jgi:nucleoside-diphosphate-sugar epimerase